MMYSTLFLLQLGGAALSLAQLTPVNSSLPSNTSTSALKGCAAISALQAATFKKSASAKLTDVPSFPPSLAYECLTSVPINKGNALALIDWYKPYLEFESTLAWLKDPPSTYQQEAVDLMGGLDKIRAQVSEGYFKNEYDFEFAIQSLLQKSHEGHLNLPLPILNVFGFFSPYSFVSVSSDGIQLPQIYIERDVALAALARSSGSNLTWTPSPVTQISGQSAEKFITEWVSTTSIGFIERHTDWNAAFTNAARTNGGSQSLFSGLTTYPGRDNLTLTFSNGTIREAQFRTIALENLTIVTSPEGFYNLIVSPKPVSVSGGSGKSEVKKRAITKTKASLGAPYPAPVIVQEGLGSGGFVSGYFLNRTSTAVLSITSFASVGEYALSFQNAVTEFLQRSKAAGMKKLVIDLSGNTGGTVLLGIDLFKQLFPTIEPYSGGRLRAHKSLDLIGNSLAEEGSRVQLLGSPLWYRNSVDMNGQNFSSWDSFYGPFPVHGDFMTATTRYNFSDADQSEAISGYGIVISGYANESNVAPQYFAAKDIVILTDGVCASTCSVFSEQMKTQAGVQFVVAGGRPEYSPMQAVAGTRGSLRYGVDQLQAHIGYVLNKTDIKPSELPSMKPPPINMPALSRIAFNFRDQVRESAQDVPIQFLYEPAECRIFYTSQMLYNYEILWQTAADATWKNPSLCVNGSTTQKFAGNNATSILGTISQKAAGSNLTNTSGSNTTVTRPPRPSFTGGASTTSMSASFVIGLVFIVSML